MRETGEATLRLVHLVRSLEGGGKEVAVKSLMNEISNLRPDWEQIPITTLPAPAHLGFYSLSPNVIRRIRSFSAQATKECPLVFNSHGYGEFHADIVALLRRMYPAQFKSVLTTHGMAGFQKALGIVSNRFGSFYSPTESIRRLPHLLYDYTFGAFSTRSYDVVIATSNEESFLLSRHLGLEPSKLAVLPPPVPQIFFQEYTPKNDPIGIDGEPVILYTGRIDKDKGLRYLLDILPSLKASYPRVKLVLVGPDFGYKKTLLQMIFETPEIKHSVVLLDHVSQEEIVTYYHAADCFVLPSLSEGFSLSVAEALASGLPVICTNVGAAPEIMTRSKGGILVAPGDGEQLLRALELVLGDSHLRKEMGTKGRIYATDNLTAESIAQRYVGLYEALVNHG